MQQATIYTLLWSTTAVKGKAKTKWATFDSEHAFSLPYTIGSTKWINKGGLKKKRAPKGWENVGGVKFCSCKVSEVARSGPKQTEEAGKQLGGRQANAMTLVT